MTITSTPLRRALLALLLLALLLPGAAAADAPTSSAPRMPAPPLGQVDLTALAGASPSGKLLNRHIVPGLASDLARLLPESGLSLEEVQRATPSLRIEEGRVQVEVSVAMERREEAARALEALGAKVTGQSELAGLLQAWVPVERLAEAAAEPAIDLIRSPAPLVYYDSDLVGTSPSEGVVASNANVWHAAGKRGAGVKVAIVDGGFMGYQALLGTGLPASVTVRNFVDGETDAEVATTTAHGTACAEVVHDMAPDATLYLVKIATNLDLEEAVTWLRDTAQVQVISTSMGWSCLTPGDGTGFFADLVRTTRSAGIVWATAAGNERQNHWIGPWRDDDGDDVYNYTSDQDVNYLVTEGGDPAAIPAGYAIRVAVRWDDWSVVDQDLDLYILRWTGSEWEIIGGSEDLQNGSAGQKPTEADAVLTYGASTYYGFMVVRYAGSRAVHVDIVNPGSPARLDEYVPEWSVTDLADAPDAISVAAADVSSFAQESYSSQGPLKGPGGTMAQGLAKPDITGYANVSTSSYTKPFNGTSAATPHVAGAAALVLCAFPAYTPDQVEAFLTGRAADLGATGNDLVYGAGRLWLANAPAAITPTHTASPTVTRTSTASPTATRTPATPAPTNTPRDPYTDPTPTDTRAPNCWLPLIMRAPQKAATATPTRTRTVTPTATRTVTATPTGQPAGAWINTQDAAAVRAAYLSTLGSNQPSIGWTGSVASCIAGTTSAAFKADVLNTINFYRGMAGVPALSMLDTTMNGKAQKAALMMAANQALDHSPPSSWSCYSVDGNEAAGNSNLSLGRSGRAAIAGQMEDDGGGNSAVGHRRWILYPQTRQMGTGDTTAYNWQEIANALWVFDHDNMWGPRPSTRDSFVAWPPPGHVPEPLVYARWSLSVAEADFSGANVNVSKNGSARSVTKSPVANGYGENTLVWEISSDTPAIGDVYNVSISNMLVNGSPRTISYQVTVIGVD